MLHKKLKFLFLILILNTLLVPGSGVRGQAVEFEHINKSHGLPSNYVTSIIQDKYGMMWFGTFSGLVRFDGYNYKVFLHKQGDSTTLPDNLVRSLHITAEGNLLVANENHGFSIFNYKTEKFTRFMHKEDHKNSLSHNDVISVLVDRKGIVWVGTWGGINRYDPVKKKFNFYPIKSNLALPEEPDFISSIVEEWNGKLLLYVTGSRVIRFNPATQTYDFIKLHDLPKPKLKLNRGGILYIDKLGYVWIGTELNGLVRLDPKTHQTRYYNVENGKLTSNILMCITQDKKGRLWIGTDGGGLMSYNYNTDSFSKYQYNPNDPTSLSGNAVYSVFEDYQGHIWAGAYASGLNVIKNNKRKFEYFGNKGKDGFKLSYKSVLSFAEADSGKIFIGTDGGGLNIFDPEKKSFSHFDKKNSAICSDIIKTILKDSKGNLWLGTFGNGLCKVNLSKKEFIQYTPFDSVKSRAISHLNVWSLKEDKDSNIWIGFLDAGLNKYKPETKTFKRFLYHDSKKNGLTDGSIIALLVDTKNNLWAGTESGGLCMMGPERKKFISFQHTMSEFSLPSNNVTVIKEDSQGNIWVGTKDGGVSKLENVAEKRFKNFTKYDGLAGNNVSSIEEDNKGNMWLGTDNGISFLNTRTNLIQNFDVSDGLQALEFAKGASFKDQSGYLYFGGTDGFNRFHPDSLSFNSNSPNVYISGIKLFNNVIEAGQRYKKKVYFNKPVYLLDTLKLAYTDYVFSIDFTCTDYTSPEKNKFAYKLEGFESEWNYVDATTRSTTYTNLAPGTYRFFVKASNNDGIWNHDGASLVIVVSPPWYSTWWFKIAVFAFLILSLIAFNYIRLKQIRRKNYVLSKLVRQKTFEIQQVNNQLRFKNEQTVNANKQLESQQKVILKHRDELEKINDKLNLLNETKDKLFSIIGHDLRNPVTALTSLTGMLQQNYAMLNDNEKHKIVDHIQTSATSLRILVNNLLNWAMVQGKNLHPAPEAVNIFKVTEDSFKLLKLHALGKGIQFVNNCSKEHRVYSDSEMFQAVLRNLVSNAIKFTDKDGKITVSSARTNGIVEIRINDTGAGMTPEKIELLLSKERIVSTKGTSQEKGSGIGLVIVREFIEVNKGSLNIISTPGEGSTFIIKLPAELEMA